MTATLQAPPTSSDRRVQRPARDLTPTAKAPVPAMSRESSTPPGPVPSAPDRGQITIRREPALPTLMIYGHPFYIEVDGDRIFIRHRNWSLMGAGDTLLSAYKDLLAEARELAPVLSAMSLLSFDEDALALYRFVVRFA